MPYDLHDHLKALERYGLIRHIDAEVDKNWELSAVARWVYLGHDEARRYAVKFDRVKGFDIPVVVGAIGASYKTYAVALEIDPHQPRQAVMAAIRKKFNSALDHPIDPIFARTGRCKERIDRGENVSLHKFPAPVWTPEKDMGAAEGLGFITSAYCVSKDPDTGIRNVGTYRMMLRAEPDETGMGVAFGNDLWRHIHKNEERNQPTEVAAVIGADPAIGMVSTTELPYGTDEFTVASALRGEAIPLVKCETVNLEVPADADIVIEGCLLPRSERPYEPEAPFGEYTGYQGSGKYSPVFKVSCVTYRSDCVMQGFLSQMPPSESSKLRQIAYEAMALKHLQRLGYEGVVDLHMPESAQAGVTVVSIRKTDDGQPARIASAILSLLQPRWGKFVIVTDDDVDIYDLDNLLWAMTFRTSLAPDRTNICFLNGMIAQVLDYSAANSIDDLRRRWDWPSRCVLIDATRPYKPYPVTSLPAARYLGAALKSWERYGLPDLDRKELPRAVVVEGDYLKQGIAALPAFLPKVAEDKK
jgi:UbiD family decarboxylase